MFKILFSMVAVCGAASFPAGLTAQSRADSTAVLLALADSLRDDHAAVIITRFHCPPVMRGSRSEDCPHIGNGRWSPVEGRHLLLSLGASLQIRTAAPDDAPLPVCSWWAGSSDDLAGELVSLSPPKFYDQRAEVEVHLVCGEAEGTRLSFVQSTYLLEYIDCHWRIVEKRRGIMT